MSRLDLKSRFCQIPLDESNRKYTEFLNDNKCYQFKVVQFGLVTSLAAIVNYCAAGIYPTDILSKLIKDSVEVHEILILL